MNELAIHIEYLLLHHDCVIVPHLGGFVAQAEPSSHVECEELFLPPIRIVRFNADLQSDGSNLFLQSLMDIYGLTHDQAAARCLEYARQFNAELLSEGTLDFGSIGIFTLDDNVVTLSPCESGVTSPDYYGLDAFSFPELDREAIHADDVNKKSSDDRHITIRVNRNIVNIAATVAASIIMFMLFGNTAQNTNPDMVNEAESAELYLPPYLTTCHSTNMIDYVDRGTQQQATAQAQPVQQPEQKAPVRVAAESTAQPAETAPQVQASETEQQPEQPKAQLTRSRYNIVLSCKVPMADAIRYRDALNSQYNLGCQVSTASGSVKVVIPMPSEKEAYAHVRHVRTLDPDLQNAWVWVQ